MNRHTRPLSVPTHPLAGCRPTAVTLAPAPSSARGRGLRGAGGLGLCAALVLGLAGCGQKGPLYLPGQPKQGSAQPAPGAAVAPATSLPNPPVPPASAPTR
jgi:predicted small lipoprotein YifL